MFKLFKKISPTLFFWGIFAYVILQVPYPNSLTSAIPFQIFAFFIFLFFALTFTLNLFLKFFLSSVSMALGIIFLLLLKALDALNLVSVGLTTIAVGLLLSYFRKAKRKGGLTLASKIPKLINLRRKKS